MTTKSKFESAHMYTMKWEGHVITDDKSDPGGTTNCGISLHFLKAEGIDVNGDGIIDSKDVLALNWSECKRLYKEHFWSDYLDELPTPIASKIYDMRVNLGAVTAIKLVQSSLTSIGVDLVEDGILGPKTISAIRQQWTNEAHEVSAVICVRLSVHYYLLVSRNHKLSKYLYGWLRRGYAMPGTGDIVEEYFNASL